MSEDVDGSRPLSKFKGSFKADFSRRKKMRETPKAPASLSFAVAVAVLMSAMYLFKAFSYMPSAIEENDVQAMLISFGLILLFFFMFVRFIIALFRLSSGSRRAWATTVRMAISYLILLSLGLYGFTILSPDITLGSVVIPWWVMAVVMAALIVYMFLPRIREFFTPAYATNPSGFSWFLYLFGLDPFRKGKISV